MAAPHKTLTDIDLHPPVRFTQDEEPTAQRPGDQWLDPTTGYLQQWNETDDGWIVVASSVVAVHTHTNSDLTEYEDPRDIGLDEFAVPAADVSMGGNKLTNLATPTAAGDAATKAYADAIASGLSVKQSVRAGTTANITLSGEQTIDGVSVVAGDRVLVKNQSTASQNGIYVASGSSWSRSTDADADAEVTSGMFTFVTQGTVNGANGFILITANPITVGSTGLTFTQFSAASPSGITVQDEGSPLSTLGTTLNFVGGGVVAEGTGATKTITIPGASGLGAEWIVVAGQGVNATVKARADYICTGTADQTIMQSALDALPDNNGTLSSYTSVTQGGGGVVFIGWFSLTGGLVCNRDHVTIAGLYGSTFFSVASGFPNSTAVLSLNRDAQLRPCYYSHVRDIVIAGNNVGSGINGFDLMTTRSRHERLVARNLSGSGMVTRGNLTPRWAGNSNTYTDCLFHGNAGWGWTMQDYSEDNRMRGCEFFSNGSGGMRVASSAWLLSHSFAWGNTGPGVLITGSTARIHLSQFKFEQNDGGLYVGIAASGTYPSEVICDGCEWGSNSWTTVNTTDDVQIAGAGGSPTLVHFYNCYWDAPYPSDQARYGINYVHGDQIIVRGGRITASYGSGKINFNGASGSTFKVFDLANYNPLGLASISPTGSPMTITAGNTPEVIYVRSGSVSSITKSGNQIAAATNFSVHLDPAESCVVTYSSAPTLWRDRR